MNLKLRREAKENFENIFTHLKTEEEVWRNILCRAEPYHMYETKNEERR